MILVTIQDRLPDRVLCFLLKHMKNSTSAEVFMEEGWLFAFVIDIPKKCVTMKKNNDDCSRIQGVFYE